MLTEGWTDARLIAISPEPFGRGIKRTHTYTVDPDHMPQIAASDQDLHCLYKIHEFLKIK